MVSVGAAWCEAAGNSGAGQTLGRGDHISPLAVPDLTIAVGDILI